MIELSSRELAFLIDTVVKPLAEQGAAIYCFGSRARGDAQAYSDVDLMVVSDRNHARLLASIREAVENSNFPYVVDIVQERDFAESYRASYLEERVLLTADTVEA